MLTQASVKGTWHSLRQSDAVCAINREEDNSMLPMKLQLQCTV